MNDSKKERFSIQQSSPNNSKAKDESKMDLAIHQIKRWFKNSEIKNLHALSAGPGKSRAFFANTIAKQTGQELHHVSLDKIKGKYIGETEKNLERLFAEAEKKSWILFFDEADALFGKRTQVEDVNHKYANQEVSYILRKIQLHPNLVLVGVKSKTNLDERLCKIFHLCVEV